MTSPTTASGMLAGIVEKADGRCISAWRLAKARQKVTGGKADDYEYARAMGQAVEAAELAAIFHRDFTLLAASLDTRERALVEALRELEMRAREAMPTSDEGIMDFHKLGSALSAARAALALYDGEDKGGGYASG